MHIFTEISVLLVLQMLSYDASVCVLLGLQYFNGLGIVVCNGPVRTHSFGWWFWSAGGDMELRFCISQRQRSYGLTFVHT